MQACADDLQDCYVIDNNGYVVISERGEDVGKFFGEIEGSVLQELVDMEIFKNYTVYDLQALCERCVTVPDGNKEKNDNKKNKGSALGTVCFTFSY